MHMCFFPRTVHAYRCEKIKIKTKTKNKSFVWMAEMTNRNVGTASKEEKQLAVKLEKKLN
jgi:hypothetical protein